MSARRTVLVVRGLVAGYGAAPVLQAVDLTVPAGTIAAVVGANGAGKTTLLRALSGMIRPAAGQVLLAGRGPARYAVEQLVRRGMAHVPEGRGVISELTVDENLRLGGLWRRDRADAGGARRGLRALRAAGPASQAPRPPALRR